MKRGKKINVVKNINFTITFNYLLAFNKITIQKDIILDNQTCKNKKNMTVPLFFPTYRQHPATSL